MFETAAKNDAFATRKGAKSQLGAYQTVCIPPETGFLTLANSIERGGAQCVYSRVRGVPWSENRPSRAKASAGCILENSQ
jgi:hypothetical protein